MKLALARIGVISFPRDKRARLCIVTKTPIAQFPTACSTRHRSRPETIAEMTRPCPSPPGFLWMFQGRNLEGQHAMVSRVEGQLWKGNSGTG